MAIIGGINLQYTNNISFAEEKRVIYIAECRVEKSRECWKKMSEERTKQIKNTTM